MFDFLTTIVLGTILSIVGIILIYVLVIPSSKRDSSKFVRFLHDIFNFKKLFIEDLFKFFYISTTVSSIVFGTLLLFGITYRYRYGSYHLNTFSTGLLTLVAGTIGVRITYEVIMLSIIAVKNIVEINNKLNNKNNELFNGNDDASEAFSRFASKTAKTVSQTVKQQASKAQDSLKAMQEKRESEKQAKAEAQQTEEVEDNQQEESNVNND